MDYSTLPPPPVEIGESKQEAQTSLYEALQALPDRRRGAGKRYALPVLLCLLLLAKMAGQTTLKGATEWVRLRAEPLAACFGLKRKAMPCQMTYKRLLEALDAQVLTDLLAAFFTRWEAQERCGEEPSRLQSETGHREHAQVAIDGKAVRATSKEAQPVHQLSAYDVQTGVVLFQVNVREKQNEISALKPLLTPSFIQGRIFTLDAMHTQTELCAKVHRGGGYYILVAKDNQPTLANDLADFFETPPFDWRGPQAQSWDKGHGRLEHRHILCSPELNEWFANRWAGVAQVFCLQRSSTLLKTGKVRRQTVYGLSNLSLPQAPPQRLLTLNRGHWGIENRLRLSARCHPGRRCVPNAHWGGSQHLSLPQQRPLKLDGSPRCSQRRSPGSLFRCSPRAGSSSSSLWQLLSFLEWERPERCVITSGSKRCNRL